MIYTTTEAARELGLHRRTVQGWCERLGVQRVGRTWVIDEEALERIREAAYDKPGRPVKNDKQEDQPS